MTTQPDHIETHHEAQDEPRRHMRLVGLLLLLIGTALLSSCFSDRAEDADSTFEISLGSDATAGGRIDIYSPRFQAGAEPLGGCDLAVDDRTCSVGVQGTYASVELVASAFDPNAFSHWSSGRCGNPDGVVVDQLYHNTCWSEHPGGTRRWNVVFTNDAPTWEVRIRVSQFKAGTTLSDGLGSGSVYVNGVAPSGRSRTDPDHRDPNQDSLLDFETGIAAFEVPRGSEFPLEVIAEPSGDDRVAYMQLTWENNTSRHVCIGLFQSCLLTITEDDAIAEPTTSGVIPTVRLHAFVIFGPPLEAVPTAIGSGWVRIRRGGTEYNCHFDESTISACEGEPLLAWPLPKVIPFPADGDMTVTVEAEADPGSHLSEFSVNWASGGSLLHLDQNELAGSTLARHNIRVRADDTPGYHEIRESLDLIVGDEFVSNHNPVLFESRANWTPDVIYVSAFFDSGRGDGSVGTSGSGLAPGTASVPPVPLDPEPEPADGTAVDPTPHPLSVADISGRWRMNVTVTEFSGVCGVEAPYVEIITVTQTGSTLAVSGIGGSIGDYTGTFDGQQAVFGGTKLDTGGTTTATFSLDYDAATDTMSGREDWSWSGDSGTCPTGGSRVSASHG